MSESLETDAVYQEYLEKYTALGVTTEPIDRSLAPKMAAFIGQLLNKEPPTKFIFCEGLNTAWEAVLKEWGAPPDTTFVGAGFLGNTDAHRAGWYHYHRNVQKLPLDDPDGKIATYIELIEGLHFVWNPPGALVFCERNNQPVMTDENGQLHCDDGPVIAYGDGTKIWALHGVILDEQIIMRPETQTLEQIQGDSNNDRRAIRIRRYGWAPYLTLCGAKVLDEGPNVVEGTYEALFETPENHHLFIAVDPSSDIVDLPVPTSVTTCEEAQIWLDGGVKYNVLART